MAAILGGGLAGLSTGYYLLKNSCSKLFLLEASHNCGGWIKSIKTKNYVFEQGPRTIRPKGPTGINTLNMIHDLGLSEHVVPIRPDHPAAKNRMIYVNQSLYSLPSNISSLFFKTQPFTKPLAYALLQDLRVPQKEMKDDSIYNFAERRFGKEIADYAISPMICGICAGDAKEISVKFLMKKLFEMEQNHGGVVKGLIKGFFNSPNEIPPIMSELAFKANEEKWSVYTIRGGLEIFPTVLYDYIRENNVAVHLNQRVKELDFVSRKSVSIKNYSGNTMNVNHIYSAIPAFALAKLVDKQHPTLANLLRGIPFVTVGIVNLYFNTNKRLVPPGFGFLVPPLEKSPILGVVFDSCCIPDQKGTVLTVMLGGKWFPEKFGTDPTKEKLLETALKEVKSILNITEEIADYHVSILKDCIPQYIVGHYERVEGIREYIRRYSLPLSVVGSSYDGVGVNDVIYSAKMQVGDDQDYNVMHDMT